MLQLSWTSEVHSVCSVAPTGHALLAGATADSLIFVRSPFSAAGSSVWEAVPRPVSLLAPLAVGWASLAASGSLPGGLMVARSALQFVCERYDPNQATPRLLWALIAAWWVTSLGTPWFRGCEGGWEGRERGGEPSWRMWEVIAVWWVMSPGWAA